MVKENVPKVLVDALLFARRQFHHMSGCITDQVYNDPANRIGIAIDCSSYVESIEVVLQDCFINGELPPFDSPISR